ncbi:hypothetical protein NQZ68_004322 [Dissostichus eleginoides]|nr:hypothetical protein NQZ68_004322 [Dissostichus eleginoides]
MRLEEKDLTAFGLSVRCLVFFSHLHTLLRTHHRQAALPENAVHTERKLRLMGRADAINLQSSFHCISDIMRRANYRRM